MKKFLLLTACLFPGAVIAGDYPKSQLEREMDKMGSFFEGKPGPLLHQDKVRSKSTEKVLGRVNKYLYEATVEILKSTPIISADSETGVIITEWYKSSDKPGKLMKATVLVKGTTIAPESLEVHAFEKSGQGGSVGNYIKSAFSITLEDKILRKARELYIKSQDK